MQVGFFSPLCRVFLKQELPFYTIITKGNKNKNNYDNVIKEMKENTLRKIVCGRLLTKTTCFLVPYCATISD